jgi:hypothetical protein
MSVNFKPLTPDTWHDFETLFGEHGAYSGCWCMYWRLTRREFNQGCGLNNKAAIKSLVERGTIPGLIAYQDGQPAGWISIAPREQFGSLERSPTLKRLDDAPVWSIVCFYVSKENRGNILLTLIGGAVDYAYQQGARIVEAYPTISTASSQPVDRYMGTVKAFLAAGFEQKGQGGSKAIMRRDL